MINVPRCEMDKPALADPISESQRLSSEGQSITDRLAEVYTWLREPDCIEEASLAWLMEWMDRRPVAQVAMVAMLMPQNLSAAPVVSDDASELGYPESLLPLQPTKHSEGWQDISTAPHERRVLLGWYDWRDHQWCIEAGPATTGQRFSNGYSNLSAHGSATHWQPLPAPPQSPDSVGASVSDVRKAPPGCTACFDETDCSNIDICNVIQEVPPPASREGER